MEKKKTIFAVDRGIQFGDGCFTTATVLRGKILFLSDHLNRLKLSCKRLSIVFPYWLELEKEMKRVSYNQQRAILKIIITRGPENKRGYSSLNNSKTTRIVHTFPWFDYYYSFRKKGMTMGLSPIRIGRNPHLAGLKHLNRLEQVLICNYLKKSNVNEMLVLDSEGLITECCTSNIFWRKDNIVYTPFLNQAGVNGIMRQFFLRILRKSFFKVFEIYDHEETLFKVDEIVICNVLMPIVPIKKYKSKRFFSRKLFKYLLSNCKKLDLI